MGWVTTQTPPLPPPRVQPAQSATFFPFSSPPSHCARGRLPPESPDPLQAARRRSRPSLPRPPPRPRSHTRGPRAARGQPRAAHSPHGRRPGPGAATPFGCSPGCALPPRVSRPDQGGSRAPSRRGVVLGVVLGQSRGGRPQNNGLPRPPEPHAPGSALPAALVAGGCWVEPGTPSARCAAKCTQQDPTAPRAPLRASSLLLTRFSAAPPTSPAHSGRRLLVCMPRHPPPVPLPF